MRQVVLDTETTGMNQGSGSIAEGHNVIEIGCVEMINRRLTGQTYHQYIRPNRKVDPEAIAVHGITDEFLEDKPLFSEVVDEFISFIQGAELVIHNATFDVTFLDAEFERLGIDTRVEELTDGKVVDSLRLARKKHPGQKNNLDALCRRYGIDNSNRTLHGALLDAQILADVYLILTGGQTRLLLDDQSVSEQSTADIQLTRIDSSKFTLKVITADKEELSAHKAFVERLNAASGGQALWSAD